MLKDTSHKHRNKSNRMLLPWAIFIKEVLLGTCTGISLQISLPCVCAVTNEY